MTLVSFIPNSSEKTPPWIGENVFSLPGSFLFIFFLTMSLSLVSGCSPFGEPLDERSDEVSTTSTTASAAPNNISVLASATYAPSDGLAVVTIVVIPKDSTSAVIGAGKTIEVDITSGNATLTGASACRTPSLTCTTATDAGGGQYTVKAVSATVGTVIFSATQVELSGDIVSTQKASVLFDNAQFSGALGATLSVSTSIDSTYAGKNLYITAGTMTFDATTSGANPGVYSAGGFPLGDVFIRGGTLTHTATTGAALYRMSLSVNSLNVQGTGAISADGIGYTSGRSYGADGTPSVALASNSLAGGSHGGLGGKFTGAAASTVGPTYDDFKNPLYPGAGITNSGGGVIRVVTGATGVCAIGGTANIKADGGLGSAGGSIYLNCGYFTTDPGWTGLISARGGTLVLNCAYQPAAGGGGRIALLSQAGVGTAAWGNSLAYPEDAGTLSSFKQRVKATGGAAAASCGVSTGNGGAGTVFLKHSGISNGDLIIDNSGITQNTDGSATVLPAVYGTFTAAAIANATITVGNTLSPALGAANYTNYFSGMTLRPDLSNASGTATNWSDDNILTVLSNTNTTMVMTAPITGITPITSYRTIFLLDRLEVSGGAVLSTVGDIYLTSGIMNNSAADLNLSTGGIISYSGNAGVINANAGITFPGFSGLINFAFSSGTYTIPADLNGTTVAVSGGSTITLTGGITTSSSVSVTGAGSSLTSVGNISASSLTVSGTSAISAPSITTTGNIDITSTSTSALVANTVSAADFNLTDGTVKHYPTTSTTFYTFNLSLTGNLTLNSTANIDVSGLGYIGGQSYGTDGTPSVALSSNTNSGASHGGLGGILNGVASNVGATYGDFKNPKYPGASGANGYFGGGVVRISTSNTGVCTFNGSSNIKANGNTGCAGGSIYLNCGTYVTAPAWTGVITANGGGPIHTCAYLPTSGGGGRIAMFSQANTGTAAWGNNLAYPVDAASLTSFKARVKTAGGDGVASCGLTYGNGAAGTIYLKNSSSVDGDLIIDNSSVTQNANGLTTDFVYTTVNSANVGGGTPTFSSYPSTTQAQVTAAATPFSSRVNLFANSLIHIFLSAGSLNPLDVSHVAATIVSNDGNNFVFSGTPLAARVVGNDMYRFVFKLDHLDIGASTAVTLSGADVILNNCDLHSVASTTFDVPGTSTLTGNSLASSSCLDASVTTKGASVNFTNYYLP